MAGIRILNRLSYKAAVLIKQFVFHDKLPLGHIAERIPLDGRDADLTVFREPAPECQMAGLSFLRDRDLVFRAAPETNPLSS